MGWPCVGTVAKELYTCFETRKNSMEVSTYADKNYLIHSIFKLLRHSQSYWLQILCRRFKESHVDSEHARLCSLFLEASAAMSPEYRGCCIVMIKEYKQVYILCFAGNVFELMPHVFHVDGINNPRKFESWCYKVRLLVHCALRGVDINFLWPLLQIVFFVLNEMYALRRVTVDDLKTSRPIVFGQYIFFLKSWSACKAEMLQVWQWGCYMNGYDK